MNLVYFFFQYNQHFASTLWRLIKKTVVLRYHSTSWVHFTLLAPMSYENSAKTHSNLVEPMLL